MFTCSECPPTETPQTFYSFEELETHLAGEHFNFYPYECEKCRFAKFPTEYALVMHCRVDHGLKDFYIRYRYTPENKQKQLELRKKLTEMCERGLSTALNAEATAAAARRSESMEKTEEDNDSYPSSVDLLPHPRPTQSPQTSNAVQVPSSSAVVPGQVFPANPLSLHDPMSLWCSADVKTLNAAAANANFANSNNNRSLDLSPLDFAPEAFAPGGLDFAAIMGEADDLVRRPRDLVTCQVCGLQVSNQRSSLVYHANTKHIKLNLYQCGICNKTWQTIAKSDVLKHVKAVHNGDESMIIDNRKRLGFQLRVFVAKCFPPKHIQKNRAMLPPNGAFPNVPSNATNAMSAAALCGLIIPKEEDIGHEISNLQKRDQEGPVEDYDEDDGLEINPCI